VPKNDPPLVEAPLEKLQMLAELRARHAEIQRQLARHSPPRPRPWHDIARPEQLIPKDGEHSVHLYLSGRGWGKVQRGRIGSPNRRPFTPTLNGR
jgi:hypothetical protein